MSLKALAICAFFHMQDPHEVGIKEEMVDMICKQSENIVKYSRDHKIEEEVVLSIIWNESRFQPDVVSNHGACGLMQIIPKWSVGKRTCNDLKDPSLNILEGIKLLTKWRDDYGKGSLEKGICGYAAGYNCSDSKSNKGRKYSNKIIKLSKEIKKKLSAFEKHMLHASALKKLLSDKYRI